MLIVATLAAGAIAFAQGGVWTVVKYPADEGFQVRLVAPDAPGGGGKADESDSTSGPVANGRMEVKKEGSDTKISLNVVGLPVGAWLVYAADGTGAARVLDRFSGSSRSEKYTLENYDTFMVFLSRDSNLKVLPPTSKMTVYSVVPKGLKPVPRPK
jgi:hypothetical protein